MALNNNALTLAQEELDRVIGENRLPSFQDRENLPYVNALIKEVLRWESIAPLGTWNARKRPKTGWHNLAQNTGLSHVSSNEDTYSGYRIPKGAVLIPNIWYQFCLVV